MKTANIRDLMYSVIHSDDFDEVLLSSDVELVLGIALRKMAIAAPICIDIGNGHALNVELGGVKPMLRLEVLAFALLMEQRLREKDADKGESWKAASGKDLVVHIGSKTLRLEDAVRNVNRPASARHAVDLANLCMMVADVSGALDSASEDGGAGWVGLDQVQMS